MKERRSILIVEDDEAIVDLVTMHLRDQGYDTHAAGDGISGLDLAVSGEFDLIVLDIMLPGLDGLSVCRKVRERNNYVPILMLSAKSEEIDKIVGLEIGADDYITKPFGIREFVARVRAMLRRVEDRAAERIAQPSGAVRRFGALVIDPQMRAVTNDGRSVELTAKEYDLLSVLSEQPGRAFSRNELLELVWGYQYGGYSHTVNSHINRLRAKIEANPAQPRFVETVWGYGYRWGGDAAAEADSV